MASSSQQSSSGLSFSTAHEVEQETLTTALHGVCADPNSTIDELRVTLNGDRSAAAQKDAKGKFPLHIIAKNQELHSNIGSDVDTFILKELLASYPQASSTPDESGCIPFVAPIKEWIEVTHGLRRKSTLEIDSPSSTASAERCDLEASREQEVATDTLDKVIPPRLTVTEIVSWSIRMLSAIVDQERRSSSSMIKSVASIPSFLKALLLIEDDEERAELFDTSLVRQTLLCPESLGPWLLWMLESDKAIAQERAVIYLEMLSSCAKYSGSDPCEVNSRRASCSLFFIKQPPDQKKKRAMYVKASNLRGIIHAMLNLDMPLFERGASTEVIQFILDQRIFEPATLFIIVLDIGFFLLVIVFFILSSNAFFSGALLTDGQTHTFRPNEAVWDMCSNGTIIDAHGTYDPFCNYHRDSLPPEGELTHDDPLTNEVCTYTFYYEAGLLQASNGSVPENYTGVASHTCSDKKTLYPNQTVSTMCRNQTINDMYDSRAPYCNYFDAKSGGSDYFYQRGGQKNLTEEICLNNTFYTKGIVELNNSQAATEDAIHTCTENVFETWYLDTKYIVTVGLCIMSISACYFILRHSCAWFKVPRKLLIHKFGFWSVIDVASLIMAVATQSIFLYEIRHIWQKETALGSLNLLRPGYLRHLQQNGFLESYLTILRPLAAVTFGLLFLKILGYFKMVNRYLATFVFALGVIAEDIFWFIWILILFVAGFAQMFYTILSSRQACTTEGDDPTPFCKVKSSYLYVYTMLLAHFEIDDFYTPFSVFLFVLYTFVGIIVVLNFLIAIISDSYDKSMTRIANHFARARIMFVVELVAFQDFFRYKSLYTLKLESPAHGLHCLQWSRFLGCIWCGEWTKRLCVMAGCLTSGAIVAVGSIFWWPHAVDIALVVLLPLTVFILLAWIARGLFQEGTYRSMVGKLLLQNMVAQFIGKYVGKSLLFVFHFILGRSGDGTTIANNANDKGWAGRLQHIQNEISHAVNETEARLEFKMSEGFTASNTRVQTSVEGIVTEAITSSQTDAATLKDAVLSDNAKNREGIEDRIKNLETELREMKQIMLTVKSLIAKES